jgi:hypothetical protein
VFLLDIPFYRTRLNPQNLQLITGTLNVVNSSGTNANGTTLTIQPGLGTGTGTLSTLVISGPPSGTGSGTTQQTAVGRHVFNDTKALTSGSATTLVSIPLGNHHATGGHMTIYLEAFNGTDQCTRTEEVYWAATNKNSTFTTSITTPIAGITATACSGTATLTAAYAITSANPALIQVTPTLTNLASPTSFNAIYEAESLGQTNPTF